jgi:hypothetical protein
MRRKLPHSRRALSAATTALTALVALASAILGVLAQG